MRTPEQIRDILDFLTAAQPDNPLCLALRALLPAPAEKCAWQEKYEALKHNAENEALLAKARIAELEEKLAKVTLPSAVRKEGRVIRLIGVLIALAVPCAVLWGLGLTGEVAAAIARWV